MVRFSQPATALCSGEPSARPGRPVAGSLDSHRASLAAAARLSPVSLSVHAARRPSAFIAHRAHKRPDDVYMTDLGALTPRDTKFCRPAGGHRNVTRWEMFRVEFENQFLCRQKNSTRAKISPIKISVFPFNIATRITSLLLYFERKIWEGKNIFSPSARPRQTLRLLLPP